MTAHVMPDELAVKSRPDPRIWSRFAGVASLSVSAIIVLFAALLMACGYVEAWHVPYFEQRFAPTVAIAHGQPIYQTSVTGPLFCNIYAPLSYLAFLPAAFLPNVQSVFAAGSLLATLFFATPLLTVGWFFWKRRFLPMRDVVAVLLFSLAAIASLRPLNYTATQVTADSPAICLLSLSLVFLYISLEQKANWFTGALSSAALVLGVGCKQNMLFAALVVIWASFFYFGRRFGFLYLCFCTVFSVAALYLVMVVHHDLGSVFFNDIAVPSRMPFAPSNLLPGTYRLFSNLVGLSLILAGVSIVLYLTKAVIAFPSRMPFCLIFFVASAVLCPLSIRIYAVEGGDVNDFSHAVYFFLLGLVVATLEGFVLLRTKPQGIVALRILMAMGALSLFGSGLPTRYTAEWKGQMRQTPSAIEAFRYSRQHPDAVYFPFNPIGVYLAEQRFYHTDWGVMIRQQAHEQTSADEVFAFIPKQAHYVAVPKNYILGDSAAVLTSIAPHHLPAEIPGLSNFTIFSIER